MRIQTVGVLSDSHLTQMADMVDLAQYLCQGPFQDVDLILHAGDIINPDFLALFDLIPIKAVRGNCDPAEAGLPVSRMIPIGDYQIGLIHGWGSGEAVEINVRHHFAQDAPDIIVYGHSHLPVCHRVGPQLIFNPGSVTDRRRAPTHTVGKLTLDEQTVRGELIDLPW